MPEGVALNIDARCGTCGMDALEGAEDFAGRANTAEYHPIRGMFGAALRQGIRARVVLCTGIRAFLESVREVIAAGAQTSLETG